MRFMRPDFFSSFTGKRGIGERLPAHIIPEPKNMQPRINTYPLLQGGSQQSLMGSLMPLGGKRKIVPLIGAPDRGGQI